MITVTEKAAQKALQVRSEGGAENQPLRVAVRGGGCSGFTYDLYFDNAKETDNKFHFFGLDVVIDPMSAMYLGGTTIDYVEEFMQSGFKFTNPLVKSTCGCGSSFSV